VGYGGFQMNKVLFGSVALAAMLAGPAVAADMGVPRAAVAPAASWTGFYVGGNIGGVWGNTDPGFIAGCSPAVGASTVFGGVVPNLPTNAAFCTLNIAGPGNVAGPVTATGTQTFHNKGWTAGGQVGFNYQYQWAVFGIEADFQAFAPKGTVNFGGNYPLLPNAVPCVPGNFGGCGYGFTEHSSGRWLTTVRGKVGAVWGNWLLYGTMGVAWAKMSFASSFVDTVGNASYASFSQTKAGVAGGAGLSYMITRDLIVSVEYLRTEIWGVGGDVTAINVAAPAITANYHYDATFIENIVRLKLDHKF
jgi:outer membrane immunogenic protein